MELEFVDWLRKQLPPHPQLRLGIGDDAAILALGENSQAVVSSDLLTEGVDFLLDECGPRRVGHKALAVNLSDLAAMAARPVAAVVSLALPREHGLELAAELYRGLLPLAQRYNVAIAGGDTNTWPGPLVISICAIGETNPRGSWLRSGAQVGDWILVTGEFGGSIMGKHLDFEPRNSEALKLAERYDIHAAIDVSDGLSLDLSRVAQASGCGALLDLDKIPVTDAARELSKTSSLGTSLDHALSDGEDFELILAVAPDEAKRLLADHSLDIPLTCIGEFIVESGLWKSGAEGTRQALEARGYEH